MISMRDVRVALIEALDELQSHNASASHVTPDDFLEELWRLVVEIANAHDRPSGECFAPSPVHYRIAGEWLSPTWMVGTDSGASIS